MERKTRGCCWDCQYWYLVLPFLPSQQPSSILGHDVADDMLQAGLSSVTMIQRGNTCEFSPSAPHLQQYTDDLRYSPCRILQEDSRSYKSLSFQYLLSKLLTNNDEVYYNATVPTEAGDRESLTQPMAIVDLLSQINLHHLTDVERPRFDALEEAGFKLDRYGSIIDHLYNRMGGHYIDVGTSAKISKGLIKIQTSTPVSYTETGILFHDGTELKADVVVFATGFEGNMRYLVRDVFGEELAEEMGDFWGLDKEGELNGAWKGTGRKFLLTIRKMCQLANESRSSDVVSWRYNRPAKILFQVHCNADRGKDARDAAGGL